MSLWLLLNHPHQVLLFIDEGSSCAKPSSMDTLILQTDYNVELCFSFGCCCFIHFKVHMKTTNYITTIITK